MTTYRDEYNHVHHVVDVLGQGGQGAVYKTRARNILVKLALDRAGRPQQRTEEARRKLLGLRLLPLPHGLHVTLPHAALQEYSGYVMELLEDMRSFAAAFDMPPWELEVYEGRREACPQADESAFLRAMHAADVRLWAYCRAHMRTGGLRRRLAAYLRAACIMAELHNAGLVYCDFSQNNAFVSSDEAFVNVWLIDADNLDFEEETRARRIYTPEIAAPELVREEDGNTAASDTFAFAATLFRQLLWRHPFEGAAYDEALEGTDDRESADAMRDAGAFPWIFDAEDESNAPADGAALERMLVAPPLMELFRETFGAGRLRPHLRPCMSDWARGIAAAADGTIRCDTCGMDWNFPFEIRAEERPVCPWCDAPLPILTLRSYFTAGGEKGRMFWQTAIALRGTKEHPARADVPLRAVRGFRVREAETAALHLNYDGENLHLRRADAADITCAFSDPVTKRIRSEGFETGRDSFCVYCSSMGIETVVEGVLLR